MSYIVGLSGIRYNNYFNDNVTWFKTATQHGDTNNLTSIDNFSSDDEYYSWEWIGYFRANSNESYTFYTDSDDASYLWLGNNAINSYTIENALVNNGGLHGTQEISGTSSVLVSGQYYPIRIQFGENEGGDIITVSFSTDTISKTTDGSGYYFYKDTVLNSLNLSGVYLGSNLVNKIYLGNTIVYNSGPAVTPTVTPTPSITPSVTATPTITPTNTSSPTITPTPSQTPDSPLLTLVYDTNLQSQNKIIAVPIRNTNNSAGTIYWGDGASTSYNESTNQFITHTYTNHGIYTVTIDGTLKTFDYSVSSYTQQAKPKLSGCSSFGNVSLTNLANGFANCRNLTNIPTNAPPNTTSIDYLFYDTTLNDSKMVNYFQPSTMTTLRGVFAYNPNFNQDVSNWDVSAITSMKELFRSSTSFNQNISLWDISSNTNMDSMFASATSFNQNIGSWNVSNVTTFANTFDGATSFNQDLSSWNISGIISSTGLNNFMRGVTLSSSNYSNLLVSWNTNKNNYRTDLSPNFGSSKYCSNTSANVARSGLVSYGWIITDGGPVVC